MGITAEQLTDVMANHIPVEGVSQMYGKQWICAAKHGGGGCTFVCDRGDALEWAEHVISQFAAASQ